MTAADPCIRCGLAPQADGADICVHCIAEVTGDPDDEAEAAAAPPREDSR